MSLLDELLDEEGAITLSGGLIGSLLCYLVTLLLGTGLLLLGARCRSAAMRRGRTSGSSGFELIAREEYGHFSLVRQRLLVSLAFSSSYLLCLLATLYVIYHGGLHRGFWTLWLGLFALNALAMLGQALVAAVGLRTGHSFRGTAFLEATGTGLLPIISDQFDLFKDIVFAGFCFQSHSLLVQFLAPCSLAYSLLIHVYFICDDSVLAELSQCYIPLLLLRSSPPSIDVEVAEDGNTVACSVWPIFYRQTTPTKRWVLLLENLPQCVLAAVFLKLQGVSLLVAILNLLCPVLQLSLAFLLFHPLRRATGPFLGHRVARALQDHDCHYAQRLWEEAEAEKDLDLFKAMLPEIRQLRQAFQLQVGEPLSEDSLLLIREWWPVLVEQTTEVSLYGHDLQADGAKVLSKALEVNRSLQKLSLVGNALSDFGVQVLASAAKSSVLEELYVAALKNKEKSKFMAGKSRQNDLDLKECLSNPIAKVVAVGLRLGCSASVMRVDLSQNDDLGLEGLQAITEAMQLNVTLRELTLRAVRALDESGARCLAETLRKNRVLRKLDVRGNSMGDEGTKALIEAARVSSIEELHIFELRPFEYHKMDPNQALAQVLVGRFSQDELDLHFCCLGDDVTQALSMDLTSNKSVLHLRLEQNFVKAPGAQALSHALKENSSLFILNLGMNSIGDVGAQALSEALLVNNTLREIILNKNNIGDAGADALGAALYQNNSLRKLAMVGNVIEDLGIQVLVSAAGRSSLEALQLFELSGQEPNQAFAAFLAGSYKEPKLNLDRCGFHDEAAKALAAAIRRETSTNHISLRYNDLSVAGCEALNMATGRRTQRKSILSRSSDTSARSWLALRASRRMSLIK